MSAGAPPQHALNHHAAVLPILGKEPAGEEVQGPLGVVRALHVQADEPAEGPGLLQNPGHVALAEVLGDVEPHLRELDRDIDLDPGRGHPVEHRQVVVPRGHGLRLGGDALAQEIERAGDGTPRQLPGGLDPFVDRFAGHEPAGEFARDAVPAHEVEDAPALREPQESLTHDHDRPRWVTNRREGSRWRRGGEGCAA